MKVPVRWLDDWISTNLSPEDLGGRLTYAGLELEGISRSAVLGPQIVVAVVASMAPHPRGDRLTLCQVYDGQSTVQVVCGARNMGPGDHVVLARVGAVLPGGAVIQEVQIRGEGSAGMLCSEQDLGLSVSHEGLILLPRDTVPGEAFQLEGSDRGAVLDVNITPNRADCLSILGVARELSALTGVPLRSRVLQELATGSTAAVDLQVLDPVRCPVYWGRVVTGVKVGPSPAWLVARLGAAGLRSINNVVDATNYVLLDRGHPLHAFDLTHLKERRIEVRCARPGEVLECLDGVTRRLHLEDLVICDGGGPVALAGVMGGLPSAVTGTSTDLFLESAIFSPETVRQSARRHALHTEASHRFERGVDPEGPATALNAVVALIQELGGGIASEMPVRVGQPARAVPPVLLRPVKVNALLGLQVPSERMVSHLRSLGMEVREEGESFRVTPPSYRLDIVQEADLAEEIARLEGYTNIPTTLPVGPLRASAPGGARRRIRQLVEYLANSGLSQVINYAFVSPAALEALEFDPDDLRNRPIRLRNPISEEMSVMRTCLVPSLLRSTGHNVRHQMSSLQIFEIGRVFLPSESGQRPVERYHLGVLLTGHRHPLHWAYDRTEVDVLDLKGVLEGVGNFLRLPPLSLSGHRCAPFMEGHSFQVDCAGRSVGTMGQIHPALLRKLEIGRPVFYAELDLEDLWGIGEVPLVFKELSRFPAVERDLALLVPASLASGEILAVLRGSQPEFLEEVTLFDIYEGRGLPAGLKSLAYRLRFRSSDRTLTDDVIQAEMARMLSVLSSRLGVRLRE